MSNVNRPPLCSAIGLDATERGVEAPGSSAGATSVGRAPRWSASRCARDRVVGHLGGGPQPRVLRPKRSTLGRLCSGGRRLGSWRPLPRDRRGGRRVDGCRADRHRQFGLQPLDAVQFAFAEGWHEDEFQPRTGLPLAVVERRVLDAGLGYGYRDVGVPVLAARIAPEDLRRSAARSTLTAGAREQARMTPDDAFSAIDAIVPADVLRAANGRRRVLRAARSCRPTTSPPAIRGGATAGRSASAASRPPSPTRAGFRRPGHAECGRRMGPERVCFFGLESAADCRAY